jgi:hypothetical protein
MDQTYFQTYIERQKAAYDAIPLDRVAHIIGLIRKCREDDRQLFAFGNGGSASNVSHFITDLGKSASDKMEADSSGRRFRCLSLNENRILDNCARQRLCLRGYLLAATSELRAAWRPGADTQRQRQLA